MILAYGCIHPHDGIDFLWSRFLCSFFMFVDFGRSWPQRLQIISGLVLFVFALFHFLNHALGLISLDVMLEFQEWRVAAFRSVVGTIVLGGAIVTHMGLVMYRLAMRSSLKMPTWEWVRILFGLFIPVWLIPHVVGSRGVQLIKGTHDDYMYMLPILWPDKAWEQSILLIIVWVHACIGLHYWLRINAWYRRMFLPLFALAVAIPITSIAGFTVAAPEAKIRVIEKLIADMEAQAEADAKAEKEGKVKTPPQAKMVKTPEKPSWISAVQPSDVSNNIRYGFFVLLAIGAAVFMTRYVIRRFGDHIELDYKSVRKIRTPAGPTLLEISRTFDIPHASQCGGRARCSTCRVRIHAGGEHLAPAGKDEAATLARIKAAPDVRLACQIRPSHNMELVQLVRPASVLHRADENSEEAEGVERTVAVMFLDVRGFTQMSADKLPYDVVYILNSLFNAIGEVIKDEGGWIDKYMGDGIMVIFGRDSGPESGTRHALRAAQKIDLVLEDVNTTLTSELKSPLRIGIGLHTGPLVLGKIGHYESASLTVIGSTVNTAARLEALTKEKGVQLILSADAFGYLELDEDLLEREDVSVRGISEPVGIYSISRARDTAPTL